jgi:hypothetical protein
VIGGASAGVEKDPGSLDFARDDTRRRMTQEKNLRAKRASSPFCDFFSLGAGVTPAEGSVKPTVGFTLNQVIYPSQCEG